MADSREIRTMRTMEWERVKGRLRAILATYWDDLDNWNELCELVEEFILKFGEISRID